jgi:hypothetical protein
VIAMPFPAKDYTYTAYKLRHSSDAVVKAVLSNNINIILAALDIAAGSGMRKREWEAIFDALNRVLAGEHDEASDLPMDAYQRAYDKLATLAGRKP